MMSYERGTIAKHRRKKTIQNPIPIEQIITIVTANIVIAAIALSLVGATFAVGFRHYTAQNWHPHPEDAWYYIISGSLSVMLAILGFDTAAILAATSGVNMPLALVKTGWDKYTAGKVLTKNTANIDALKLQVSALEERLKVTKGG